MLAILICKQTTGYLVKMVFFQAVIGNSLQKGNLYMQEVDSLLHPNIPSRKPNLNHFNAKRISEDVFLMAFFA